MPSKYIAKTFHGLEGVLEKELIALGAVKTKILSRAVEFEGGQEVLYKANFKCRTALRILKPIWRFSATDENTLYRKAYACDWSRHFSVDQTFAISATVNSPYFSHSKYASLKLKDAICDRFRKKFGNRPSVDRERPDLQLNIQISNDRVNISIDSSGAPLFKRGYRDEGHIAPINEILAAGMIALSEWNRKKPFYDPMAGTGTLAIEAAMFAHNVPAQILRKDFAFMKWADFDKDLWNQVSSFEFNPDSKGPHIMVSDRSRRSTHIIKRSASFLDLENHIDVHNLQMHKFFPPHPGIAIINPPYGERMDRTEVEELYQRMGNLFKSNFIGSNVWMITSNLDGLKSVGLKTSRRLTLYNGPLECKFVKYEMYEGSRR